jgi:hypothetical protein
MSEHDPENDIAQRSRMLSGFTAQDAIDGGVRRSLGIVSHILQGRGEPASRLG